MSLTMGFPSFPSRELKAYEEAQAAKAAAIHQREEVQHRNGLRRNHGGRLTWQTKASKAWWHWMNSSRVAKHPNSGYVGIWHMCFWWFGKEKRERNRKKKQPLSVIFCVYLVVSVVMVSKLSCKIGNFHDENNVFFWGNSYHYFTKPVTCDFDMINMWILPNTDGWLK